MAILRCFWLLTLITFASAWLWSSENEGITPKTYKVKYDAETNQPIEREEQPTQCWQFTYAGPRDSDMNNTVSCDLLNTLNIPCFAPVVYTEGEYRLNGPNLTQIDTKCKEGQTVSGETCVPYCTKDSTNTCVQMTYTLKDKEKTVDWQVHFCGKGVDASNNDKIIEKGCYKQSVSEDDRDVEVCFCQGDKCNSSSRTTLIPWMVLLPVIMMTYFKKI